MANLDEIKTLIHAITPDALEARGVLKKAKKGYVCPLCGNGEGKDGTGIDIHEVNGTFLAKCFKCGAGFDNFKLLGLHYHLDPGSDKDFIELCRRTCEDFGIPASFDDKSYSERRKFDRVMEKFSANVSIKPPSQHYEDAPPDPAELEMIRADIVKAQANLENLPENARRGLSINTLRGFGCGFINKWTHPKSRLGNYYETPTPRFIIPTPNHYLARLIVDKNIFPENQRDYIREKAHAGSKEIFNLDNALSEVDKISTHYLIATEGEIDAMSIWQAVPLPIVATGGTSGYPKLISQLKKRGYGSYGKPVYLLIIYDPDEAGRKAAKEFREAALDAGIPAIIHFLAPDVCKLDANDILREQGSDALLDIVGNFYSNKAPDEFASAKNEIAAIQAAKLAKEQAEAGKSRAEDPDVIKLLFDLPWNDVANSRRLILTYGDSFRFIRDTERWLTYNNGAWFIDSKANAALYPVAIQVYDLLKAKRPKSGDAHKAADIENGVAQWGKKTRINSAIELLRNSPAVTITLNDLNTRPELLNVANGTIDLTTGILYPHRSPKLPQDFITKKINVPYIPDARDPVVDGFFKSILPDEETRAALLRFLGYCTTGFARERVALFIWGEGGNGKSTLVLALQTLMGDYACELPVKTLLLNRFDTDGDKATPAIASLFYKRFAFVDEIPSSSTLDETKFKYLTGDNPITGRNLNENFITINHPSHKLILSGNHMPELKDPNDPALQDRLIRMDFPRRFTKDDPDFDPLLKDKLLTPEAQQALLALLVRNAVDYCRAGLLESPSMKAAKRNYFIEQDFISEFISENCERDDDASIPRPELIRRIQSDCDGARGMSSKAISSALGKIPELKIVKYSKTFIVRGIKWHPSS